MKRLPLVLGIVGFCALTIRSAADAPPTWDPVERYAAEQVEGWRVLVHKDLDAADRRALRADVLRLLSDHLFRVSRAVPAAALEKLRRIPIWIEVAHPKHPCMCYHPSADWLRTHGMNPDKAGAVEIANCKNFLSWTHEQPWMVLHELAHGYHQRFLGESHAGILRCYEHACAAGLYESVLRINGRHERHYALTNAKEYFAEMTEAFFGTNDFYPFVRAELKEHDPDMYEMLRQVWGVTGR